MRNARPKRAAASPTAPRFHAPVANKPYIPYKMSSNSDAASESSAPLSAARMKQRKRRFTLCVLAAFVVFGTSLSISLWLLINETRGSQLAFCPASCKLLRPEDALRRRWVVSVVPEVSADVIEPFNSLLTFAEDETDETALGGNVSCFYACEKLNRGAVKERDEDIDYVKRDSAFERGDVSAIEVAAYAGGLLMMLLLLGGTVYSLFSVYRGIARDEATLYEEPREQRYCAPVGPVYIIGQNDPTVHQSGVEESVAEEEEITDASREEEHKASPAVGT